MNVTVYKSVSPLFCTPMSGNPFWISSKVVPIGNTEENENKWDLKAAKNAAERILMASLDDCDFFHEERYAPEEWQVKERETGKPLYIIRAEDDVPF